MALREDTLLSRWGKELMLAVCLKSWMCSSTNVWVDPRGFQTHKLMELAGINPLVILQEFVIQTYLWVLAGWLRGIRGLLKQRFHDVPENFKPRWLSPMTLTKRNCACVRLVMFAFTCIIYICDICGLPIYEPNTSDIPTFWLLFVFAAHSNANKSILCVTDNFLFASARGKPNNFKTTSLPDVSRHVLDGTLQKCCVY